MELTAGPASKSIRLSISLYGRSGKPVLGIEIEQAMPKHLSFGNINDNDEIDVSGFRCDQDMFKFAVSTAVNKFNILEAVFPKVVG